MSARSRMLKWRERMNASYQDISKLTGISSGLIAMVERGHVTHPKIVEKIQNFYNLTDDEAEELLPRNRRPHDPGYEPDRYVALKDRVPEKIPPKKELVDTYMNERHSIQIKRHEKRSEYL